MILPSLVRTFEVEQIRQANAIPAQPTYRDGRPDHDRTGRLSSTVAQPDKVLTADLCELCDFLRPQLVGPHEDSEAAEIAGHAVTPSAERNISAANCSTSIAVATWQVMPLRDKRHRLPEAIAFGKRVRELREARGWTQERLAEAAEINWLQVGHIERGASDPKLSTIWKLAKALAATPDDLLSTPRRRS